MNELIQQARELFKKACPLDGVSCDQSLMWGMIPQLCDALETAQEEIERLNKAAANLSGMISQYADKTRDAIDQQEHDRAFYEKSVSEYNARAEKAEANARRLINQAEEYKQKFNTALVRAEKAKTERDTYKAALQNWHEPQEGE